VQSTGVPKHTILSYPPHGSKRVFGSQIEVSLALFFFPSPQEAVVCFLNTRGIINVPSPPLRKIHICDLGLCVTRVSSAQVLCCEILGLLRPTISGSTPPSPAFFANLVRLQAGFLPRSPFLFEFSFFKTSYTSVIDDPPNFYMSICCHTTYEFFCSIFCPWLFVDVPPSRVFHLRNILPLTRRFPPATLSLPPGRGFFVGSVRLPFVLKKPFPGRAGFVLLPPPLIVLTPQISCHPLCPHNHVVFEAGLTLRCFFRF